MNKIIQYRHVLQEKPVYSKELLLDLLQQLLDEKRYAHVLRVLDTARILSDRFQIFNQDDIETAVLLHDFAKGMSNSELKEYAQLYNINLKEVLSPIYHAVVGAWMAQYFFHINNTKILNAVYYHTTGHESFIYNEIGAILYLADYLEPGRKRSEYNPTIEDIMSYDLKTGLRKVVKSKIYDVIDKEKYLDNQSILFYHSLL